MLVRRQFPALQESYNGRQGVFFDNPGGTQVHESVIAAMTDYLHPAQCQHAWRL